MVRRVNVTGKVKLFRSAAEAKMCIRDRGIAYGQADHHKQDQLPKLVTELLHQSAGDQCGQDKADNVAAGGTGNGCYAAFEPGEDGQPYLPIG